MKILVIGTGMYVTGRNTDGYGTIFPSIIEFQRNNNLKNLEVIFVGYSSGRELFNRPHVCNLDISYCIFCLHFATDYFLSRLQYEPPSHVANISDRLTYGHDRRGLVSCSEYLFPGTLSEQ